MNGLKSSVMTIPIFLVLALGALAQDTSAPAAPPANTTDEIKMTAKKYEFDPNLLTVKQGDHVRLVITALDRDHGFKLAALGINRKLKKGVPTTVEFTADEAGTFAFQCSDVCGIGHHKMKGKLVVEAVTASSEKRE